MHIFFSGIGGTAIGPLALIAKQAGYTVSGSDQKNSLYTDNLKKNGLKLHIGQSYDQIAAVHKKDPIDWIVFSSAITRQNAKTDEMRFANEHGIKTSKRDELLNEIIARHKLKLIAIAGTHGKTTTTAMVVWLFKQLGIPVSYSVGAKISFGPMGEYVPGSEYFVYECDEFDRNFLAFKPYLSLITGVTWDHHEIFKTRQDYKDAFVQFINQSNQTVLWAEDFNYLNLELRDSLTVLDQDDPQIDTLKLAGQFNRRDAWLAIQAAIKATDKAQTQLAGIINEFPGLQRRMEKITDNLYSDYAHTPEKIDGAMSAASDMLAPGQKLVVIYEPLTNRRQHYLKELYKTRFKQASHIYWVPSYLAREDPNQKILTPAELINYLPNPRIATPSQMDENLQSTIKSHLKNDDMVVAMSGGGGGSLDEWLRDKFKSTKESV